MDPNATLAEMLTLADRITRLYDEPDGPPPAVLMATLADELATRVQALDLWLCQGGFLPNAWRPR